MGLRLLFLIPWISRVFTTQGVFAGELELAEAPVMGDWNITVDVSGQVRNGLRAMQWAFLIVSNFNHQRTRGKPCFFIFSNFRH